MLYHWKLELSSDKIDGLIRSRQSGLQCPGRAPGTATRPRTWRRRRAKLWKPWKVWGGIELSRGESARLYI
eukprot:4493759-Pyramimonas_sp.AAC.1